MEIELTKSAKKSLATLYKEYCQRIDNGQKKAQAVCFENCPDDIIENKTELKRAGFITVDILGDIELTDKAIIYMENKTVDAIKEWLSIGSQLIP